jgi:hypothetical protein
MKKIILIPSAIALSAIVLCPAIVTFTVANRALAQTPAVLSRLPLSAGATLKKGTKYPSPSGSHTLVFAEDGNLIVHTKSGQYIWGLDQVIRNLGRVRPDRIEIKPDGTFGAYDSQGKMLWVAPGKRVPGAKLSLTDAGVLQLLSPDNEILWASNGVIGTILQEVTQLPMPAGATLKKGMKYTSPSGNHLLTFAEDGNLIVQSKSGQYIWGLDQVSKNLSRTSRVEIKPDGTFGVYDAAKGTPVWTATGKRVPRSSLNISYDGALQLLSPTGEILWASNGSLLPSIQVFLVRAKTHSATPDPGWSQCIEMDDPKIKINATASVTPSALNAVANIYQTMIDRLKPQRGVTNPRRNFDGFKVYIDNGEPWSELGKLDPIGKWNRPLTGTGSNDYLRGGGGKYELWIT